MSFRDLENQFGHHRICSIHDTDRGLYSTTLTIPDMGSQSAIHYGGVG